MNFLFGEGRSGTFHPSQFPPKWIGLTANSKSGVAVDDGSVRNIAAAYACVKVLSESVASLPLILYKRLPNGGKERATKNVLYSVLHDKPNRFMTSVEWLEMLMGHLCLRGNAFNQILRDNGGRVKELIPLNPALVRVRLENQELRYKYEPSTGPARDFTADEVLHVKGQSSDGIIGESPISVAREVFGFAVAVQVHGAKSFANGVAMRGILKMPGHFDDEGKLNDFRKQWKEMYGGPENTGDTVVLEDGLEWVQVGMTMRDAQFLELAKLSGQDICRIWRMPPHKVGYMDNATFTNIEHQGIEFVTDTLMPWLRRIEQAINVAVLGNSAEFFVEFLVDGLLRGDFATRNNGYAVAVTNGWMNRNEVRIRENLNPEPGLDEFLVPLNMSKDGQKDPKQPDTPKKDAPQKGNDGVQRGLDALEPIVKHECGRLVRRRMKAIEGKNFAEERETPVLEQSLVPLIEAGAMLAGMEFIDFDRREILDAVLKRWDDATSEEDLESVRLKNSKLILNSILGKVRP